MEGMGLLMHIQTFLRTLTQEITVPKRIWNNSQPPNVHKRQLQKHMYITVWHKRGFRSASFHAALISFVTVMIWLPPLPSQKALFHPEHSDLQPRYSLPAFLKLFSFFFFLFCVARHMKRGTVYLSLGKGKVIGLWNYKIMRQKWKCHTLCFLSRAHLIRRTVEGWGDKRQWEGRGKVQKK